VLFLPVPMRGSSFDPEQPIAKGRLSETRTLRSLRKMAPFNVNSDHRAMPPTVACLRI
jgi:hypothetical protein